MLLLSGVIVQVNEDSEAAEDLFKQAATEMTELVSS